MTIQGLLAMSYTVPYNNHMFVNTCNRVVFTQVNCLAQLNFTSRLRRSLRAWYNRLEEASSFASQSTYLSASDTAKRRTSSRFTVMVARGRWGWRGWRKGRSTRNVAKEEEMEENSLLLPPPPSSSLSSSAIVDSRCLPSVSFVMNDSNRKRRVEEQRSPFILFRR